MMLAGKLLDVRNNCFEAGKLFVRCILNLLGLRPQSRPRGNKSMDWTKAAGRIPEHVLYRQQLSPEFHASIWRY